jgi:GT2 family glycosyltransferase
VVVNYNGGPLLSQCVESIRRHTRDYEIILIDNASTDNSLALISPGVDLRVFKLSSNIGFAKANNLGIKASLGHYLVLLNSDTVVTRNWLNVLVGQAERDPRIGLVTPKLLRPGNPPILDSTGHLCHYQTGICRDRGQGELDKDQYDSMTELPSCCFACALIKKHVFLHIGLLDEKMFLYFEDVDFSLRARIAGWRVIYSPESVVYHARGGSTHTTGKRQLWSRSRAYLLRIILKNYQARPMFLYGSRRFVTELIGIVAGVKNRDRDYAWGCVESILWNLVHFPARERVLVQRLRRIPDKAIFA